MASLPIPDELTVEIFLRLPTPADLARASATCVTFRRVTADRSFLRRYRKLHAPPLLGFLGQRKVFYPAIAPHPSATAAGAVASAADFSFSFITAPPDHNWAVHDVRDGRVLLTNLFPEVVVCDPLHRRYLLLPLITSDLVAAVEDPLIWTKPTYYDIFLVSPSDDGAAAEETSFRAVSMSMCRTMLVAFVFSSNTGEWRAIPSRRWSDLFAGLPPLPVTSPVYLRQYAYGCFYWVIRRGEESKLLVLSTGTMEFSIAEPPLEANVPCDLAMVEAGEGRVGMFVLDHAVSDPDLSYFIRQNDGASSSQWRKVKTISLSSWSLLVCNVEKYLLLYQGKSALLQAGCFMLNIDTFQIEKVCTLGSSYIYKLHAYSNFPPSLLSSPTVSSGIREDAEKPMLKQDEDVLPAEAHSHHDQNTFDASDGGQAGVSNIGDGAD